MSAPSADTPAPKADSATPSTAWGASSAPVSSGFSAASNSVVTGWLHKLPYRDRVKPRAFGVGRYGVDKYDSRDDTRYAWGRIKPALLGAALALLSFAMPARAVNSFCESADAKTSIYGFCKPSVDVEGANTWGDKNNTNWDMAESAIQGLTVSSTAISALSISTAALSASTAAIRLSLTADEVVIANLGISTAVLSASTASIRSSLTIDEGVISTLGQSTAALSASTSSLLSLINVKASSGTNADQFKWLGTGFGLLFSTVTTFSSSATFTASQGINVASSVTAGGFYGWIDSATISGSSGWILYNHGGRIKSNSAFNWDETRQWNFIGSAGAAFDILVKGEDGNTHLESNNGITMSPTGILTLNSGNGTNIVINPGSGQWQGLGSLLMASGQNITMQGPTGFITSISSINATSFFGDGQHLSGIPSTAAIVATYVPYTGATLNVVLGNNNLSTSYGISATTGSFTSLVSVGSMSITGSETVAGSDTVKGEFSVAGSTFATLAGLIGIGTTTPHVLLDIVGSGTLGNQLRLDALSGQYTELDFDNRNTQKSTLFWDNNANTFNIQTAVATSSIAFNINGVTSVLIDHSGNFEVGGSAPKARFHVLDGTQQAAFTGSQEGQSLIEGTVANGDWTSLSFQGSSGAPMGKIATQRSANGGIMGFGTSNNYASGITNLAMTIDYNGRVGIGTTAPRTGLDAVSGVDLSTSATTINLTFDSQGRAIFTPAISTFTVSGTINTTWTNSTGFGCLSGSTVTINVVNGSAAVLYHGAVFNASIGANIVLGLEVDGVNTFGEMATTDYSVAAPYINGGWSDIVTGLSSGPHNFCMYGQCSAGTCGVDGTGGSKFIVYALP